MIRWLLSTVFGVAVLGGGAAMTGAVTAGSSQPAGTVTIQVRSAGAGFSYALPPSSVATFKWTPGSTAVSIWRTTAVASGTGLTAKLAPTSATFGAQTTQAPAIDVNPVVTYQRIDGFGGALTDSSASLIAASPQRMQIMTGLFGATGARFDFARLPMGASDFIAQATTGSYDDLASGTDPNLDKFSVAHDATATIPLLQQARRLSPQLKLLSTPWSAPGWMKFGGSLDGICAGNANFLQNRFYAAYASYFVKYVQAYENKYGLPIYMVSLQNEPETCNSTYPTMNMTPTDEATFAVALRSALDASGLGAVKILGYDGNWADGSLTTYPQQLVGVSAPGRAAIAAVGYHCYGGDPSAQTAFHAADPGTAIYFTECTGGAWSTGTAANLVWEVRNNLIEPLRDWAQASTYFNLALDPSDGPHVGGCTNCRGMLTIDNAHGTYAENEDYYYWAQFSKFVDPGATRIDSPDLGTGSIQTVAFRNPDGSIVLVALNPAPG